MPCKMCSGPLKKGEYKLMFSGHFLTLNLNACYSCGIAEIPEDDPIFDQSKLKPIKDRLIPFDGFFAIQISQSNQNIFQPRIIVISKKRLPKGGFTPLRRQHEVKPHKLLCLQ